jgi:NADPH:quinone reductase-like Zn-dependent oxidoreductase
MRAAVLEQFGQPPRYAEFADPVAADGEVLVQVRAAALHRIDRARGSGRHYTSPAELPVICGIDGVGTVADEDGGEARVWFALPRAPFGSMAERTVASARLIAPLPEGLTDAQAAALINPGMAALLPLSWRAKLAEGETVLILGATGVTGRLAVQLAKLLGAGRVVAAGRDPRALEALTELGADTLIRLDRPKDELAAEFAAQAGPGGYQVILDYVWGEPTEALLEALTVREFKGAEGETRLVQVGDMAGPTLTLPAEALRSTPITLVGSGGFAPPRVRAGCYGQLVDHASEGRLRIEPEELPLAEVAGAWRRGDRDGRRQVLIP